MRPLLSVTTGLLAAALCAAPAAADEGADDVVLLGPPPVSYKTKQVKAKFLSVHADCDATLTASFTTPGVAVFLKNSDTSKGAVLSHSFRIKPLMPGVTILSVAVDFSDPLKEDTQLSVPLTFLPDAKGVGKAIKVGAAPLIKDFSTTAQTATKDFQVEAGELIQDADVSDVSASEERLGELLDLQFGLFAGLQLGSDMAQLGLAGLTYEALVEGGYTQPDAAPFTPDAAQLGACKERDAAQAKLTAAREKALDSLEKALADAFAFLEDEVEGAGGSLAVGGLVFSGLSQPGVISREFGALPIDTRALSASAARLTQAGETRLTISGTARQFGGNDVLVDLVDLASDEHAAVSLGTPDGDGFRRFDIVEGLLPGHHYALMLTDVSTGDTREVFVTTPGAAAVQAE